MALISVTAYGRAAEKSGKGPGKKTISGEVVLSNNSQFPASGIEKFFRRCDNIVVNDTSGINIKFMKSAVMNYSVLQSFLLSGPVGASTDYGSTLVNSMQSSLHTLSTTFTAFGT